MELKRIINATGVILHTGAGRAPLGKSIIAQAAAVLEGYSNLEIDMESGDRGERDTLVRDALRELTGAEDALVVNNNAGAVLLALRSLAAGKAAAVSRGQLVEIGGSFRLPEVIAAGGVKLMPVGTVNVTRVEHYREALDAGAALVVLAHRSNFYFRGRYEEPPLEEVVTLAAQYRTPVLYDLGGGLLTRFLFGDTVPGNEPAVDEIVDAGVDAVCFSGDKLLGGPQAGIIVGKREAVGAMRREPLYRALRCGKETFALLGACLDLYRRNELDDIPTRRLITRPLSDLRAAAERVRAALTEAAPALLAEVKEDETYIGGGTVPALRLPTVVVAVRHPSLSAHALAGAFRRAEPPVLARASGEEVYLDMRSVLEDDLPAFAAAARSLIFI